MATPDWQTMQKRALTFMTAKYGAMPESQRRLPYLIFQDPETLEEIQVSPNDALQEVTALTDLGKKIITMQLLQIERVQERVQKP